MVARQRLGAVLAALEHGAQFAPERDPEVERRADALGGQRQAVARAVAGEEHAVLGRGAEAVGDPVALVAVRLGGDVLEQPQRRLLDRIVRVERADADAQLVAGRERPAVAGVDVARVDPQLEVLARPGRMHLQPP